MTVKIIYPADKGAWLAARNMDVTASVAGALFGVHPFTTAFRIWAEKTGRVLPQAETTAMRRGSILEPVAVDLLRAEREDWEIEYPLNNAYFRDTDARIGATPDCFATRPDLSGSGAVQIKIVSQFAFAQKWQDPDTRDVVLPSWVAIQNIIEADLTGSNWAAVAVIRVPHEIDALVEGLEQSGCNDVVGILRALMMAWKVLGRLETYVIDVDVHAGIRRKVREKVGKFWRVVESGEHPPIDWAVDGATVLDVYRDSNEGAEIDFSGRPEFAELVRLYREHKELETQNAKAAELIKPKIMEMMGNAEVGECERWRVVAKTQVRKAYAVRESKFRALRVTDKQKKEAAQ